MTGIKIDQVDTLTSRGYDRLRISSRATEAYLIQVHILIVTSAMLNMVFFLVTLSLEDRCC